MLAFSPSRNLTGWHHIKQCVRTRSGRPLGDTTSDRRAIQRTCTSSAVIPRANLAAGSGQLHLLPNFTPAIGIPLLRRELKPPTTSNKWCSAGSVNRRPRIPARIFSGLAYNLHPACRHPTPTGKHAYARSHRVPRGSSPPVPNLHAARPRETPCDLRSARWRDCLTASPISGDGIRAARLRLATRKKHGRLNESAPHPETSHVRPFNRTFTPPVRPPTRARLHSTRRPQKAWPPRSRSRALQQPKFIRPSGTTCRACPPPHPPAPPGGGCSPIHPRPGKNAGIGPTPPQKRHTRSQTTPARPNASRIPKRQEQTQPPRLPANLPALAPSRLRPARLGQRPRQPEPWHGPCPSVTPGKSGWALPDIRPSPPSAHTQGGVFPGPPRHPLLFLPSLYVRSTFVGVGDSAVPPFPPTGGTCKYA